MLQNALLLHDVEVLEGDGGRDGMPGEGVPVVERRLTVGEGLVELLAHDHRAEG